MALLGMSIGIGFTTGILTGLIMRLPLFEQLDEDEYFDDELNFEIPKHGFTKLRESSVKEINEAAPNGFNGFNSFNGFNPNANNFNPGNFFPPGNFIPPPV
jgi:hypothetical protein